MYVLYCKQQDFDFALSAVQSFGDQEPFRQIVQAERERVNAALRQPFRVAAPQVGFEAGIAR